MKKFFLLFACILFTSVMHSQTPYNNALKMRIAERSLPDQFPLLVQGNVAKIRSQAGVLGYEFRYSAGDIASIKISVEALAKLIEGKIVLRAEFIEGGVRPLNDTMVVRNRIAPVKSGQSPLPQAYDGTGVLIGIIDTGTDWRHADFKTAGGQTRIKFIWEQSVFGGTATPQPYNYGKEWTEAQINASVCTHNDVSGNGHGTHVSGVAAGNGLATGKFEGVAPKADLVIVALNFNLQGPTIADAVSYCYSKATLLGKPCVINASVGNYLGSHDGTDLEAQLIKNMVQNVPGRVMVAAAGNGAMTKFHAYTNPPANDTSFTWFTNGTATLKHWAYGDTNQVKNLQFNIGANRAANYSNFGSIGFKPWNYGIPAMQIDTLKNNGNRIGIVRTSASVNSFGVYELYISITADSLNELWRIETKGTGLTHAWQWDMVSSGLPTVGQYWRMSKYASPDTLFTIVTSFQCLDDITTVANYCNMYSYYDYNNNLQVPPDYPGGSKMVNSSIGPTRDMRIKPDIGATGAGVFAAACVSLQPTWIGAIPTFMAPGGQHVYGSGTSASSPVVAGFAALFLQYNPTLTSKQVRNAIANCAYSDAYTGAVPNFAFGYGKLDAKASMLCTLTGEDQIRLSGDGKVYPNPFYGKTTLEFTREVRGSVFVYNAEGKLLHTANISSDHYEINEAALPANFSGVLFVRVVSDQASSVFKLVKVD